MTDNSSSSVTIAPVAFEKTVYAVNDNHQRHQLRSVLVITSPSSLSARAPGPAEKWITSP